MGCSLRLVLLGVLGLNLVLWIGLVFLVVPDLLFLGIGFLLMCDPADIG